MVLKFLQCPFNKILIFKILNRLMQKTYLLNSVDRIYGNLRKTPICGFRILACTGQTSALKPVIVKPERDLLPHVRNTENQRNILAHFLQPERPGIRKPQIDDFHIYYFACTVAAAWHFPYFEHTFIQICSWRY